MRKMPNYDEQDERERNIAAERERFELMRQIKARVLSENPRVMLRRLPDPTLPESVRLWPETAEVPEASIR